MKRPVVGFNVVLLDKSDIVVKFIFCNIDKNQPCMINDELLLGKGFNKVQNLF